MRHSGCIYACVFVPMMHKVKRRALCVFDCVNLRIHLHCTWLLHNHSYSHDVHKCYSHTYATYFCHKYVCHVYAFMCRLQSSCMYVLLCMCTYIHVKILECLSTYIRLCVMLYLYMCTLDIYQCMHLSHAFIEVFTFTLVLKK